MPFSILLPSAAIFIAQGPPATTHPNQVPQTQGAPFFLDGLATLATPPSPNIVLFCWSRQEALADVDNSGAAYSRAGRDHGDGTQIVFLIDCCKKRCFSWIWNRSRTKITFELKAPSLEESSFSKEELHQLQATALQKAGLWPGQLFGAFDKFGLAGRGLLICVVDARRAHDGDASLQVPVATEPVVAGLCKQVQKNAAAAACNKQFRSHLPKRAGLGFQFIPTELWKGALEDSVAPFCHLPRQQLKAKNSIDILTWFVLPQTGAPQVEAGFVRVRVALLQQCLVRPGATMPKCVAAAISEEEKSAIWEHLSMLSRDASQDEFLDMIEMMGLDPGFLREEPLFIEFMEAFTKEMGCWFRRREFDKARLLQAWCPHACAAVEAELEAMERFIVAFFDNNAATVDQLQKTMGPRRVAQTARSALAKQIQREERKANFAASFGLEYAAPCPVCGKPLDSKTGYPCTCQTTAQPQSQAPPGPEPQAFIQEPAPSAAAALGCPTYRRSKKIQTSFQPGPPKQKPSTQVHSETTTGPAPKEKKRTESRTRKKFCKEEDPAMTHLREIVRGHGLGEADLERGAASSTMAPKPNPGRRSRRRAPQGDRKLAQMTAARELLGEVREGTRP